MKPYYSDESVTLYHGDCLEVLATLPDASVDAVVTDPPYELLFMSRSWDGSGIAYSVPMWAHCLRVLKPGGHLLAFGGTRTYHRMACAIEDAGLEIRDSIHWTYGSGFPKSLDVSKAIDKRKDWALVERLSDEIKRARADAGLSLSEVGQATLEATSGIYGKWYHRGGHMFFETGRSLPSRPEWECLRHVLPIAPEFVAVYDEAEREVLGETATNRNVGGWAEQSGTGMFQPGERSIQITAPATDAARQWDGWGTALKPSHEPIVVARKPLSGTVAATVLEHGTGAINVDACRVGTGEVWQGDPDASSTANGFGPGDSDGWASNWSKRSGSHTLGRWPANTILTHAPDCDPDGGCGAGCPCAEMDAQSGVLSPGGYPAADGIKSSPGANGTMGGGWSGTARTDRITTDTGGASRFFPTFYYTAKASSAERPRGDVSHPTVKPLDLMRWLVRLVTPPGGTVLEPFAGSGTTAEACVVEGFRCIAIEREADYLPLIVARLTKPIERTLL